MKIPLQASQMVSILKIKDLDYYSKTLNAVIDNTAFNPNI
jgi:hypothetical protein